MQQRFLRLSQGEDFSPARVLIEDVDFFEYTDGNFCRAISNRRSVLDSQSSTVESLLLPQVKNDQVMFVKGRPSLRGVGRGPGR
jgi:hypothetical protein